MIVLSRRFMVVAALMFWQGGFTFYASVVIPVGAEVFGSHRQQALVTRRVVHVLHAAGAVALPLLAWDAVADRVRWRRRCRAGIWLVLAVTVGLLVWLHGRVDAQFDVQRHVIEDQGKFYLEHRLYLAVSTVQWAASLAALAMALGSWRHEDRSTIQT